MNKNKNRKITFRTSADIVGTINYIIKKQSMKNIEESKTSVIEKALEKYALDILSDEPIVHDLNTMIELLPKTIQKSLENSFEKMEYEINLLNQKIEILNEVQNQYLLLIIKLLAEMNSEVYNSLASESKIENILNHRFTNILKMKINEHASNELFEKKFNQDNNL